MSLDLYCEDCGRELEVSVGFQKVSVFPCEHCIENARDDGASLGYDDGKESRGDEIASLQNDLQNMVEQNRTLQEELDNTIADMHTEGT
jgi:hypothetical protein